jgi:hypothetical protein
VVLSGFKVPGRPRAPQHDSIVEGLKRAHDVVSPHGITMIVEVVNTLAPIEPLNPRGNNHADYYLDRTPEAFEIVGKTGSPFVKILYDTYHSQIMEGNLIETIRKNIAHIGHIHDRRRAGSGAARTGHRTRSTLNVFRAIRATGDFVAMAYAIPRRADHAEVQGDGVGAWRLSDGAALFTTSSCHPSRARGASAGPASLSYSAWRFQLPMAVFLSPSATRLTKDGHLPIDFPRRDLESLIGRAPESEASAFSDVSLIPFRPKNLTRRRGTAALANPESCACTPSDTRIHEVVIAHNARLRQLRAAWNDRAHRARRETS